MCQDIFTYRYFDRSKITLILHKIHLTLKKSTLHMKTLLYGM